MSIGITGHRQACDHNIGYYLTLRGAYTKIEVQDVRENVWTF